MTHTLKKTLSIVISLLLIISTFAMADFSAFAKSKDFEYYPGDNNGIMVASYKGNKAKLTIPKKIGNKKECRPEKPHPYIIRPEMLIAGYIAGAEALQPVCGGGRIGITPELILENDKYFLYLRLKENLFTKRFGPAFLINTLTVMLFM